MTPVGVSSNLSEHDTATLLSSPGNRAKGHMSGKELLLQKAANRGLIRLLSGERVGHIRAAAQNCISAAFKAILH